jgi:hypothetical protein
MGKSKDLKVTTDPRGEGPFWGTGEMVARIRAFDWSRTFLGPASNWPQSLNTTVNLCLTSSYPVTIVWGREECVLLYNDAYIPVLGLRHPDALGKPALQVLPEIKDMLAPMFDEAFKMSCSQLSVMAMLRRHTSVSHIVRFATKREK